MPTAFLVCALCGLALLLRAADAEPIVRCRISFNRRHVTVGCDLSGLATVWIDPSVAARLSNVTKSRVPCGNVEALVELCSESASLFVYRSNLSDIAGDNSLFREAIASTADIAWTEVFNVPVDKLTSAVTSLLGKAVPTKAAVALVSPYSVTWQRGLSARVRNITALHITAGRRVVVANSKFVRNYEGSCLRINGSYTQGFSVTIKDTAFDSCHAPMGSYPIIAASQGGGLYVDLRHTNFSALTLAGAVTFANCRASEGGGLYVQGSNTTGAVVASTGSTTFTNNLATSTSRYANGGACVFKFGAEYYLGVGYLGGFMDQALHGFGGGTYINATISFAGRASFVNNSALRDGGAIAVKMAMSASVNVSMAGDVEFLNNSAVAGRGGAVYVDSIFGLIGDVVTVSGARLAGNSAGRDGGAMQVSVLYSRTIVLFSNCTFSDNVALTGSGGALNLDVSYAADYDIYNLPSVTVTGSRLVSNRAANSVGGGIFVVGRAGTCNEMTYFFDCANAVSGLSAGAMFYLVTIVDSVFADNSATFGGGLFTFGALVNVTSTNFTGNQATLYGGAVYAKSMMRLTLVNINATGNWAGQQGGAIYSAINDAINWHLMDLIDSTLLNNTAGTQGGGIFMLGGLAGIQGTSIVNNTAGQQGGGIAYFSICSNPGTCALMLHPMDGRRYHRANVVEHNHAFTGGGVFISTNTTITSVPYDTRSVLYYLDSTLPPYDTAQLQAQVADNGAVYGGDTSLSPSALELNSAQFNVASSVGDSGLVPLEVCTGAPSVRVQVDWCPEEPRSSASIVGSVVKSDADGLARFGSLRVLNSLGNTTHCLQVSTTDYPDRAAIRFAVNIRGCIAGEFRDPGVGCTLCPPNQYSFDPSSGCKQCPTNANCTGGPVFLPHPGFWHSAPQSSLLRPCPNPKACRGDRAVIYQCQTHAPGAPPRCRTAQGYASLQCSRGYAGNLCGSCDRGLGYGRLSFFRCGKCMSLAGSVALMLAAAAFATAVLAFVAMRGMLDSHHTAVPVETTSGARVTLSNEDLYGAFKVLVLHLQYLGIISQLLVDWPEAVRAMRRAVFFVFAASGPQVVSPDCLRVSSNALKMLLQLVLPLLMIAAAAAAIHALVAWRWRRAQQRPFTTADTWVVCGIIGVYFFYTQMVTTSLSAFSCVSYGDESFWVRDMRVECWTAAHLRAGLPLGVLGTALLCAAVPGATVRWLATNWKDLGKPWFRRRYAFLYRAYKERYCYWEGVMCLFTICLVSVHLFARRHGTYYQLILLMLLLGTINTLTQALRPFRCRRVHRLFVAGNVCLLLTCCGVQALMKSYTPDSEPSTESLREAAAALIVAVNAAFVAVCVFVVARSVWRMLHNFSILADQQLKRHAARLVPRAFRARYRKAALRLGRSRSRRRSAAAGGGSDASSLEPSPAGDDYLSAAATAVLSTDIVAQPLPQAAALAAPLAAVQKNAGP